MTDGARRKQRLLELAAEAAAAADADRVREIGYLANLFTRTSLPYKNPGDVPGWTRRNGPWVMVVQPGMTERDGKAVSIGYPYGTIPRLVLTWLCSEAVRTREPVLRLGPSLAGFMRELGMQSTGGKSGTIIRLKDQTERLFSSTLSMRWEGEENRTVGTRLAIASAWDLRWPKPGVADPSLMASTVLLAPDFYQQVIEHPVPVDLAALRVLRSSAMRLDIYTWLTWRMYSLARPTTVSWDALRAQFGSAFATTKQGDHQFIRDFKKHLTEVRAVYRDAKVEATSAGLVLRPSLTHIPLKGAKELTARVNAGPPGQRRAPAGRGRPSRTAAPALEVESQ